MENNKVRIDFYKEFGLERPMAGLVKRITSPKGVRTADSGSTDGYSYRLHTELVGIYIGTPMDLSPGIYLVSDICAPYNRLIWNWYIFIVDGDNILHLAYPIAEFLDQKDSSWVKDAIPILKRAFSEKSMDPIKITKYSHEESKPKSAWKIGKK